MAAPLSEWRQSRWLILVELLVVILIFVADQKHFIHLSKTPFLLASARISLRVRNLRWRDAGLSRYKNWGNTFAYGIAAGLALEAFQLFISQPLLVRVLKKQPDLELFRALNGNYTTRNCGHLDACCLRRRNGLPRLPDESGR
jgi:hypothetical protein